jgi:MFS family permease
MTVGRESGVGGLEAKGLVLPLLVMAINLVVATALNVYPAAATHVRGEFSLSGGQTGLLSSAFTIGYAAAQLPGGLMAARFGRKQVTLVALLGIAITTGLFAVVSDFNLLLAVRVLTGFASGALFPTVSHLLGEYFAGRKYQKCFAWYTAGWGGGYLAAFYGLSLLISLGGWRWMMVGCGVMALLTALAVLLALRGPVYQRSTLPASVNWVWKETLSVFLNFNLLFIGLLDVTSISSQVVVATWTPSFLEGHFSFGTLGANVITGLMGVAIIVSSFFGDFLAARFSRGVVILTGVIGCLVFPTLIAFSPTPLVVFILVAAVGWAACWFKPVMFSLFPVLLPRELISTGAGYANTLGFLVSFFTPFAFGMILDTSQSYLSAYSITSLVALLGIVGFVALARNGVMGAMKAPPAGEAVLS